MFCQCIDVREAFINRKNDRRRFLFPLSPIFCREGTRDKSCGKSFAWAFYPKAFYTTLLVFGGQKDVKPIYF